MMRPFLQLPLFVVLFLIARQHPAKAVDDFAYSRGPIPSSFSIGERYPDRDEEFECRSIKFHVQPGSQTYQELVTYSGNDIHFASSESRRMTSRMQTRLQALANDYHYELLYVLRAWTSFPDDEIEDNSLHYEGRGVRVHVNSGNASDLLVLAAKHFDYVRWDTRGFAYFCVIPDVCEVNVDLTFVLDQSSSVGYSNNRKALQFISDVINFFQIAHNATQVGLITFATYSQLHFDLDDLNSTAAIKDFLATVTYSGGFTLTARGLSHAELVLDPTNPYGARPLSEGIPRIAVLITDGRSNFFSIEEPALSLHASGVQVYTVGIGNIYLPELQFIASDPDPLHVFLLDSFNDAEGFVDFLSIQLCDAPAVIEPGSNTTTEVPEDGFRYFQTECVAYSFQVSIELTNIVGSCYLYGSTVVSNPGPVSNDSVVIRSERDNVKTQTVYLTVQPSESSLIYASVRGIESNNVFSIVIWDRVLFVESKYTAYVMRSQINVAIFDIGQELSIGNINFLYQIVSGNEGGQFTIDAATNQLKTVSALTRDTYNLQIVALNEAASCHRGRVDIDVLVVDDDLAFQDTLPASIPENATVGYNVTLTTASGGSGIIEYSIKGGNQGGVFGIDRTMGNITVVNVGSLDINTTPEYELTIEAMTVPGGSVAEAVQVIRVEDINEAPFFETDCARASQCMFSVLENLSNRDIGTILAHDPDATQPNNALTYSISDDASSIIVIDSNGRITVSSSFDREVQDSYTFSVLVADGPGLTVTTQVIVSVLDANDNAPVFVHAPQYLMVAENTVGDTIATYVAEDADIGGNAAIGYSVSANTALPVTIDYESGEMLLVVSLDYEDETQRYFEFNVTASNPDGLATSKVVSLSVTDVNDNIPQFSQSPYHASVVEHSPIGTIVATIMASDEDQMGNNPIRYSITGGNANNVFTVNESTGVITVSGDIDRELLDMYTLVVEARDTPVTHNTTTIFIAVDDINDKVPVFEKDTYIFNIPENYRVNLSIDTLVASDGDKPGSPNSQIIYSIVNDFNIFHINGDSGTISLISYLDFETQVLHNITVVATDQGNPQNNGSAMVSVHVVNVNEDPPTLSSDEIVNISEDEDPGCQVAQVTVLHQDQMAVTFSLAAAPNSGLFSINANSGIITLLLPLDFETQIQHMLTITASDGQLNSTAVITVNVLDINEFAPLLNVPDLLIFTEETGACLDGISASDGDTQDQVSFSFQSSRISSLFSIDSASRICVSVLDRELLVDRNLFIPPDSQETLTVVATDNGQYPGVRSTMADIIIKITDINDNSPVFADYFYTASVYEDDGSVNSIINVTAYDLDIGNNSLVSYYLDNEMSSPFSINNTTGEITGQLDRESMDMWTLLVVARDSGSPVRSTNTTVTVRVLDVNDNAPIFQASFYNGSAPETVLPVQAPLRLLQVVALDADISNNSRITYSISGQGGCTDPSFSASECLFSIDPTSGEFFLVKPVDYETQSVYNIMAVARDNGTPHMSASVSVTINIINVDEAPPQFLGPCDVSIPENSSVFSIITQCLAIDIDYQASNDTVTYIIQGGNIDSTFSINSSSGEVALAKSLDREKRDMYEITVRAKDATDQFTDMKVTIYVIDVNDNAPVFALGLQQVVLSENTFNNHLIATYIAEDADIGGNAAIGYNVSANTALPITIDYESGEMLLVVSLDYEDETQRYFEFNVTASNPDGLATSKVVSLSVTDVNDNIPQFSQSPYHASVVEHSPIGTVVATIMASDEDQMGNDPIRYSITGGNANNVFTVNESTGVITVSGDIDRETSDEFELTVRASDSGSRINATKVAITVEDINDHAPVFAPSLFTFRISEDFSVGSKISTLLAIDSDQPETPNSNISFSLLNHTATFQVSAATGVLTLISPLDFETQSLYNITAVATDQGNPQHNDSASVLVYVLNVNENPPVISGNQTINIFEDKSPGYDVGEVSATDQDQELIEFNLTAPGNSDGLFSINASSGVITLLQPLDFETQTQHILTITASDGQLSSTATITVNVLDINEFAPVFSDSLVITVEEQQPLNTYIGRVRATDGDYTNVITYSIVMDQFSGLFNINSSSGEIFTATVLDREMLVMEDQFLPPMSQKILRVEATDDGQVPGVRSTMVDVIIQITDINDNSPVFADYFYTASVYEDDGSVNSIINVTAHDLDIDNNGLVSYYLDNEMSLPFSINNTTGEITGQLDRESMDMWTLLVVARDSGSPVRSTNTTVIVRVLDVNDNAPVFVRDTYETSIPESRSETIFATPILDISASDRDTEENGRIAYSIEGEGVCNDTRFFNIPECFFSIDSDTGTLFSVVPLNFETQSLYEISVVARDNGIPRLSATVPVIIDVLNLDEAPPIFLRHMCDVIVSEDTPVHSVITSCPAFDYDTGSSGTQTVTYMILSSTMDSIGAVFSITHDTGDIILELPLDYEMQTQYTIDIVASDAAQLRALRRIVITVADINDNAPVFRDEPYQVSLTDQQIQSHTRNFLSVVATDRDSGANGEVRYSVSIASVSSDGMITTVNVTATDAGSPESLSTQTTVTIAFQSRCELQEYSIGAASGRLSGYLLCSVGIAASATEIVLGGRSEIQLTCSVLKNSNVEARFILGDNFIGRSMTLRENVGTTTYTISGSTLNDAGRYNCKAISHIGSLQTTKGVTITVTEPPNIVIPPQNGSVAVGEDSTIRLYCLATGTEPLLYQWWNNLGAELVGGANSRVQVNGSFLVINNATVDDEGFYTCVVSNTGGIDQARAYVVVFDLLNEARAIITNVSDPDPANNCNSFDYQSFNDVLTSITGRVARTTNISGDGICPVDPCHPSPCLNGGICAIASDNENYECECLPGYNGINCETNINECIGSNICWNNGLCTDIDGGFECACSYPYLGSQCQYNHNECICPPNHVCNAQEGLYSCVFDAVPGDALVIEGLSPLPIVSLNQVINTLNERNMTGFIACEGQFMQHPSISGGYYLAWACPVGAEAPPVGGLSRYCDELIRLHLVSSCTTPDGHNATLNVVPPSTAEVSFIVLESEINAPLSVDQVLQLLQAANTSERLKEQGFDVVSIEAIVNLTSNMTQTTPSANAGTNDNAILGGVLGSISVVIIVIAVIVIVLVVMARKKKTRISVVTSESFSGTEKLSDLSVIKTFDSQSFASLYASDNTSSYNSTIINNDNKCIIK